ncbi:uncharacterized protein [Ambystoma mexicanum]|uniref:uncharacterized protein n=1 Tax=Ambystoma mexicanum TaxID=8296 RepID=UPI0037E7D91A
MPMETPPQFTKAFKFSEITISDMTKVLASMKPTTCTENILPPKIILDNNDIFTPILTKIINASFRDRKVPNAIKGVTVTLLVKKPNLYQRDPNNLRPITNLNFVLKIMDTIDTRQPQASVESTNSLHPQQSGRRPAHSTEAAMLDLQTKMLSIIDKGKTGLLILLDLIATFNLLDHNLLQTALTMTANCSDEAIGWVMSFLKNRISRVHWGDKFSLEKDILILCGVLQGASMSPLLCTLYLRYLCRVLDHINPFFTNYADDTQQVFELSGDSDQLTMIYNNFEHWMDSNWMCLNGKKKRTPGIWLSSCQS